jgi:hypothetical protein
MSATGINDSAEEVNNFLLHIRELGDKRDKEDEERTRKLEEEILQGRRERQARRAGKLKHFERCMLLSLLCASIFVINFHQTRFSFMELNLSILNRKSPIYLSNQRLPALQSR